MRVFALLQFLFLYIFLMFLSVLNLDILLSPSKSNQFTSDVIVSENSKCLLLKFDLILIQIK